jgi:hypothetical protein
VKPGWFERVGARAMRRPAPRFGIGLAGAGAALGVLGVVAIGGDHVATSNGGDTSRLPGLLLTLAVFVLGLLLAAQFRTGPLAAAGVAASAIATVPFWVFATYSPGDTPPFATILGLSSITFAVAYVVGPARGRTVYFGALLIGAWAWCIEATEHVLGFPADVASNLFVVPSAEFGRRAPDPTNIGSYSLVFALVYLIAGVLLDRRARHGMATAPMAAGIVTLIVGILALSSDLEQTGTGVALWLAGLLLLLLGAIQGRRGTNWIGAALVFVGVTVVVGDAVDTASAFGVVELLAGVVVVLLAALVGTQFNEPSELEPVPSTLYSSGSVHPSGPPPPPAGSVLG